MTKPIFVNINVPFSGFYETSYSAAIDYEESSWIEYHTEENGETDGDYESGWIEPLRLDSSTYQDILMGVTSYSAAYADIAEDYIAAFDYLAGQALGMSVADTRGKYDYKTGKTTQEAYRRPSIRLTFEAMTSPREYNFETDRLFADVPVSVLTKMFRASKAENHKTFAAIIAERFTSYDGFHSFYSNRLSDWLEKSVSDYDHNELATLFIAGLKLAGMDIESDETRDELYENTIGDDGACTHWENAVDWPKFEAKRTEARAEKLIAWIEADKEAALIWRTNNLEQWNAMVSADPDAFKSFDFSDADLPYRCPLTPDLPGLFPEA